MLVYLSDITEVNKAISLKLYIYIYFFIYVFEVYLTQTFDIPQNSQ